MYPNGLLLTMRLGGPEEHGVLEDGNWRMERARRISRTDDLWALLYLM